LYILAVGVGQYKNAGIRALPNAKRDGGGGGRRVSARSTRKPVVKVLTDAAATRAAVLNELDAIKKQIRRQDMLIFYFAGHGEVDDPNDLKGRYYLLPHDATPKGLAGSALSAADLGDMLVRTPGKADRDPGLVPRGRVQPGGPGSP